MTVRNIGDSTLSLTEFRQLLTQIFVQGQFMNARNAVIGGTGLGVVQTPTASAAVRVDAGAAVTQTSSLVGAIVSFNDAQTDLDVLGANPMGGLPRNDIVVLDAATESLRVITGTPNASPTDPTVPASAVALARLRHPAGATSVASSAIDELRVWTTMRGGIALVRNSDDQAAVLPRQSAATYRADLQRLEIYNGTDWDPYYSDKMSTAACSYGSGWAIASTGPAPSVSRVGRLVTFNAKVLRSSGTGTTVCTIPTGYRPNSGAYDPNVVLATTSWNSGTTEGPGFISVVNPSGAVTIAQIDTGKAWTSSTFINITGQWFI